MTPECFSLLSVCCLGARQTIIGFFLAWEGRSALWFVVPIARYSFGGSMVKFSPVTQEAWVQFLANTVSYFWASQVALVVKNTPAGGRERCRFDSWPRKIPWRRKWLPTPVFWPGGFHGKRSLEGYSPRGRKESDTTEHTHKDKTEIEKINNRIINGDLSEEVILS